MYYLFHKFKDYVTNIDRKIFKFLSSNHLSTLMTVPLKVCLLMLTTKVSA